jgi:chromosome segregation ATPase
MNLIQLEQTKNHYLLSIPQALMLRAKKIKPRQWDPCDSVWKYPRNKDTYQLLMNEFENDVERVTITPPKQNQMDQSERIEKQNKKISDLERQVRSLKSNIKLVKEQRDYYISTEAECLNRIIQLTSEVEHLKDDSSDLEINIKKISKLCIGEENPLSNIIEDMDFDFMLPIHLQNKLESILKSKLKIGSEKKSIVTMVHQCQDQGLLSDDAAHLIHVIRKQRNLFAHNSIDHKTRLMRVVFVIAAFSILSSELDTNRRKYAKF